MSKPLGFIYEFGPFRLDTVERMLTRDGAPIALGAATTALLMVLVEREREIVARDELIRRVWPDAAASPAELARHLSRLRKVLGSHEGGRPYLQTVAGRGYRFEAPMLLASEVSVVQAPAPEPAPAGARPASGSRRRQTGPISVQRLSTVRAAVDGGRYEIVSLLGAGGMGEVYLARDRQLDRKVALKLLSEQCTTDPEWLRRLIREARAASALNHPNILTIHEVGEVGGYHYIATEYIEGQTLRARMAAGRIEVGSVLDIALQIASALAAAHAAGIVHRDIKPENIMLRPDGYVKLLDFGLARPLWGESSGRLPMYTDPGVVMGTVSYMSPEQARGLNVDARSDVFSLGVLIYEMLTGRAPFVGPTPSDIIAAILQRQPVPLSERVRTLPPELERIVGKALRKDCSERYQSIADLQRDLRHQQQELALRAHLGDARPAPAALAQASDAAIAPNRRSNEHTALVHASGVIAEVQFQIPEVRYARSGEVNIAYQVIGDAPLDLVFVMGWISHLEYFWTEPSFARFLRRLATFARVILFDKRGTGLSDRVALNELPTLEQRMDDVRAVMEAVGSERAVLCGVSEGGPMCSLFAATYPERTIALVMMGSYARRLRGAGYPWGPTEAARDAFLEEIRNHWGGPVGLEDRAPSVADDPEFRQWWAAYLRRGASPSAAVALTRMNTEIDIRHVLPTVRVPTLVVHRSGDMCLKVEEGRYLAEHIPGAKFVELPGIDHLPFVGAQDEILDEIEEFLTGMRHASQFDRVLATVLVARWVDDGDPSDQFDDLLARQHSFFRKEVELFKGNAVDSAAELYLLATFDGPARAIRAASAIRASALRLSIQLRTGLHTGECDVMGDRVGGSAVRIAEQIAAGAKIGEVLVSSTVKDLVAGSGIQFVERGSRNLPDALGKWRLYAVERSA